MMCEDKRNVSPSESLKVLDLELRTYNALRRTGIQTIGELIQAVNERQIIHLRGVGEKTENEIMEKLDKFQVYDVQKIKPNAVDNDLLTLISKKENFNDKHLTISKYDAEYMEIISSYQREIEEIFKLLQTSIHNQIRLGLLHNDAEISGKPLKDYLDFNPDEVLLLLKIYSKIQIKLSIAEELNYLLSKLSYRDIFILVMRYGFLQATYEEIAVKLNISRERVRQILANLKIKISGIVNNMLKGEIGSLNIYLIRTQTALLNAEDLGEELTFASWANHLVSSGLLGNSNNQHAQKLDLVELFLSICNLLYEQESIELKIPENLRYAIILALDDKPNVPVKNLLIAKSTPKEIKNQIDRHAYFTGAVNSRWLSHEINQSSDETNDILLALGYTQVNGVWFISKRLRKKTSLSKRDTLEHTVRKMCLFCGPLTVDNICSGLRHAVSRTSYPVPPPEVMQEILEKCGYVNEEGLWYWPGEVDEELNQGEKVIFNCLTEKGPVLHHSELAQAFIDSELSFASLHATLNRTPLIERMDYALYKLRGSKVSYDEIARANFEGDRVPVNLEVIPETTGIIRVLGSLGILALGSGTFYSDRLPNLSGKWHCVVENIHFDTIRIVENEIRGLQKPFTYLNCQVGDRICMSFNTWDRSVSIEKVSGYEN